MGKDNTVSTQPQSTLNMASGVLLGVCAVLVLLCLLQVHVFCKKSKPNRLNQISALALVNALLLLLRGIDPVGYKGLLGQGVIYFVAYSVSYSIICCLMAYNCVQMEVFSKIPSSRSNQKLKAWSRRFATSWVRLVSSSYVVLQAAALAGALVVQLVGGGRYEVRTVDVVLMSSQAVFTLLLLAFFLWSFRYLITDLQRHQDEVSSSDGSDRLKKTITKMKRFRLIVVGVSLLACTYWTWRIVGYLALEDELYDVTSSTGALPYFGYVFLILVQYVALYIMWQPLGSADQESSTEGRSRQGYTQSSRSEALKPSLMVRMDSNLSQLNDTVNSQPRESEPQALSPASKFRPKIARDQNAQESGLPHVDMFRANQLPGEVQQMRGPGDTPGDGQSRRASYVESLTPSISRRTSLDRGGVGLPYAIRNSQVDAIRNSQVSVATTEFAAPDTANQNQNQNQAGVTEAPANTIDNQMIHVPAAQQELAGREKAFNDGSGEAKEGTLNVRASPLPDDAAGELTVPAGPPGAGTARNNVGSSGQLIEPTSAAAAADHAEPELLEPSGTSPERFPNTRSWSKLSVA